MLRLGNKGINKIYPRDVPYICSNCTILGFNVWERSKKQMQYIVKYSTILTQNELVHV